MAPPAPPASPYLPLVEISGTPLERGRQYGEAVRDRLHTALAYYQEAFGHSATA